MLGILLIEVHAHRKYVCIPVQTFTGVQSWGLYANTSNCLSAITVNTMSLTCSLVTTCVNKSCYSPMAMHVGLQRRQRYMYRHETSFKLATQPLSFSMADS